MIARSVSGSTALAPAPNVTLSLVGAAPAQLVGKTLVIDGIGCKTIEQVDEPANALHLRGSREALNLNTLIHDGVAACLGSDTVLGTASLLPPAKTPYWFDKGERNWTAKLLGPLVGDMRVFPEFALKPKNWRLELPSNLREPGPDMQLYCAELAGMAFCAPSDDFRQELVNRGYKDVRLFERQRALAVVAVTPDERAIIVAWRCASDMRSVIGSADRRTWDDGLGDEPVPRGVHRYIGQIREVVDGHVRELLAAYPKAQVIVASNSLGGGAAVQWTDQAIRSGLMPADRVAQCTVFNPVPGLFRKRAHELAQTLGERLDIVVNTKDPLRWILGIDRTHYGHIDYVDDGKPKHGLVCDPMQGFNAHMVSGIMRIVRRELGLERLRDQLSQSQDE